MIDVKLLTLLKVNETGNYTRAAEQLSLTQPAVSQHIKQIEKEGKPACASWRRITGL